MILVTGGTGMLGSHLLVELAKNESSVIRAIYRNENKIAQTKKIFDFYLGKESSNFFAKIEWVKADILDICSLDNAMVGVEKIYHCAAFVSFSKRDFFELIKINREGTTNVVNCALNAGIKKLCHVSSTAAIGGEEGKLVNENTKWKQNDTTSAYSISKYNAEREVWRGCEEGLDCVIVNPCLIVGAGNWNDSSLAIFKTVDRGLNFYTPGGNALVDARDVAQIMRLLMNSPVKNERFLCIGENILLKNFVDQIAIRLGKNPPKYATQKWMLGIAWRVSSAWAWLNRRSPLITKDTARHAYEVMSYDNSKIKKEISFEFTKMDDMIENAIKGRIYS